MINLIPITPIEAKKEKRSNFSPENYSLFEKDVIWGEIARF